MSKVKFYIIKGWRIVSHDGTEKYIKATYTVDSIDDVMQALQQVGSWQYFKVEYVVPAYFWD